MNADNEKTSHKQFESVATYVNELGGDKARVIEKVLIANNGNAAVKAIRSIRKWAYDIFANERAIQFAVMATPEDLRANAEFIRMADVIVDVPGGSNNHNYANVNLIVEIARAHGVHAVWAGWGHASENPVLPDSLAKLNPPIKFIGPSGPPMRALGDKIGSTIIAQTAGVPCIAWNGDDIFANYDRETGCLPDDSYNRASIKNATHAYESAIKVGFPVMIKASEGGGGKGIRMVAKAEDVQNAYRQVCGEVPGSPIFIMKLSSKSRHLEVQLLADEYGDAIALNGRDCSVQRRHQKIIEEGPPIAAPLPVWTEMEKAAVSLAKAVGYANAGTVEYLFSEPDNKFYFLELNPRLQVEHPVTENITGVNLPAAQLQVAMGINLYNIPDVRELYGKNRFEDDYSSEEVKIDFDVATRNPPNRHCIAVRITAENAEAGFKPTSGSIQELTFRSTPNVWGYFSMDSSGSIHEFADSQFGHLFAHGNDREQARRNMVLALKELSIRGDISTTVDYITKLIELDDFKRNKFDTEWLDKLIKANVDGIGENSQSKSINSNDMETYAVLGALIKAFDETSESEKQFMDALNKGQLPSQSLLQMENEVELILDGIKYKLHVTRNAKEWFSVKNMGSSSSILAQVRRLSDGGYLTAIGGKSRVVYLTCHGDTATGMKITIGGLTIAFSPDYDPSSLRTDVAGKLVKRLVAEGAHLEKGEAYSEIEVMKMFMPLKAAEAGTISWKLNEGAALGPGDLVATMELDNPDNVATTTIFEDDLKVDGIKSTLNVERPHHLLRDGLKTLSNGIDGYILTSSQLENALENLRKATSDPLLPVFEISEPLSTLSGRIEADLFDNLNNMLSTFNETNRKNGYSNFPAETFCNLITDHGEKIFGAAEKSVFTTLIKPVVDAATPYAKCVKAGFGAHERVLQEFILLLRKWIENEIWFSDGQAYADVADILRKSNKGNYQHVLDICRAHGGLSRTTEIVTFIVDSIEEAMKEDLSDILKSNSVVAGAQSLSDVVPCLAEIGSMYSPSYLKVAVKARKLLLQESMPSYIERKSRITKVAHLLIENKSENVHDVQGFVDENIPVADVLFSLLKAASSESEKIALVELYFRQTYRAQNMTGFQADVENGCVKFKQGLKKSEKIFSSSTSLSSMVDLKRRISRTSLDTEAIEFSDNETEFVDGHKSSSTTLACKLVNTISDIEKVASFESSLASFPKISESSDNSPYGPTNNLYVIVLNERIKDGPGSMDNQARHLEGMLAYFKEQLESAGVGTVSFIFDSGNKDNEHTAPFIFTFHAQNGFKEDALIRNVEQVNAHQLHLNRLEKNFRVEKLESHHTTEINVHNYVATPRSLALDQDKKANKSPRVFVRALSYILELSSKNFEKMLVDSLNALDIIVYERGYRKDNHIFMNLSYDFERIVLDPVELEQTVVKILKLHGGRISSLGVTEVEARLVCRLDADSPPIALRMMASNPTGYVHVINTYVEAADISSPQPVFKLIGGTKGNIASSGDSSWEGMKISSPYPLTRPYDAQRQAALRASDSLYCYDLPALFEEAVEQQWDFAKDHEVANVLPVITTYTSELVVNKKINSSDSWDMEDYSNGELELVQTQRKAGLNDVGMVAWLMTLKTCEYPEGRQVILIANDITFKAGSFGTREDVVFKLASEYARLHSIPRLFVAANSGARIGLSESIKKLFKVGFKDSLNPENGFDFLYVSKSDYVNHQLDEKQIIVEPAKYNGEDVYRITDIIGSEPDLGVENLKGSGLIAGETSIAYNEIFTMTIVLGRTVGIGAYLVRLGQRTIQKVTASPIILTGYQALNKLMGVDVYSTNDQLGGHGIMHPNGVSHLTAPDHLHAVKSAMQWLSYVPAKRGGLLPISNINGIDSIDRTIDFVPARGEPYDPRFLITGKTNEDGNWLSGFFDKGSFVETLAGWANAVVVGRARLGGIPMGVIATENRTSEAIIPADPADVLATEVTKQQAGCVWFPNSAYKTAQAINDFRSEDLPLMIFANWRGFSGGQRDMFEEVLKYGSFIVDAFVAFEQPVFVFIPPHAEIRGGAWVVLDASINANVMEMYASSGTARGGVLEANGTAAVKYRQKDLLKTMHRIDEKMKSLQGKLNFTTNDDERTTLLAEIKRRETILLPVYEQVAIQFCELHDTPGRMQAVGVIEKAVEWRDARSYFFWRLRRKLAEFDFRKKILEAGKVGNTSSSMTPLDASDVIKKLFHETSDLSHDKWNDDEAMLNWMHDKHEILDQKVTEFRNSSISQEVYELMVSKSHNGHRDVTGVLSGITRALTALSSEESEKIKKDLKKAIAL